MPGIHEHLTELAAQRLQQQQREDTKHQELLETAGVKTVLQAIVDLANNSEGDQTAQVLRHQLDVLSKSHIGNLISSKFVKVTGYSVLPSKEFEVPGAYIFTKRHFPNERMVSSYAICASVSEWDRVYGHPERGVYSLIGDIPLVITHMDVTNSANELCFFRTDTVTETKLTMSPNYTQDQAVEAVFRILTQ